MAQDWPGNLSHHPISQALHACPVRLGHPQAVRHLQLPHRSIIFISWLRRPRIGINGGKENRAIHRG
ncbi:MAG: hypothetical protein KKH22_06715 [Proteobacteria bacterium]|nr:hypothetical protein [Pseudomonadota bacterium]